MKRLILFSFVVSMSLSLTACSDSWNNYNTPEKFLKAAANHSGYCYITTNSDYKSGGHRDYNLEIKNALSNAGSFKKTDQSNPNSQRFFSYVNMYYNGFIGLESDRFCIMSVFDDGFIKIDYEYYEKEPKHKYTYFEMDATKAYEINDLVVDKIANDERIKEEDRNQAYQDASIENFIQAMEKKSSVKTVYYEHNHLAGTLNTYNFYDKGDLLSLIKDVEYTKTSKGYPLEGSKDLIYNDYSKNDDKDWTYSLYDTGNYVEIRYYYKNRLGEGETVKINYEIDATKGKEILAKALELGKQTK